MGEEMNTLWGGIFVFWMLGSWMTHVIACIQAGEWLFLIAGALFFRSQSFTAPASGSVLGKTFKHWSET
jgi:hypothetical protein